MKKIFLGLTISLTLQSLSAQTKTFSYNMVQIVKNMNVTELATRKTKIVINNSKNTVSVIDSEFPTPYVFKIDKQSSCDTSLPIISCFLRNREDKLYIFSYNKNRLEIMNIAGDGTRYINIKP
ncbi:hypothetical protein LPB90_10580 [Chryseobacterium sp. LC2016-29]|uniref:hypothetical protein n=1 Tax=Chryseobacterium sp. LC2016-29 TaxID=2897331 RepID=UPI001E3C940F|nr:hypothetical protein [Chryseobacterium sp. LC2016-29]MCD0478905.1 hypothetical protein [Chryseobacterium sp. LC2016-29]